MLATLTCDNVEGAHSAYSGPVFRKFFFRKVQRATTSALVDVLRKGAQFSRDIGGRNASAKEENVLIGKTVIIPPIRGRAVDSFTTWGYFTDLIFVSIRFPICL